MQPTVIAGCLSVLLLLGLSVAPESTRAAKMEAQHRYGIVIGAGSTSTRINIFHFTYHPDDKTYILKEASYNITFPGLSDLVAEPQKAADSVQALLVQAKQFVPSAQWPATPLAFYASEGLRGLVEQKSAGNVLDAVSAVLLAAPFRPVSHDDPQHPAAIIPPVKEGAFGWLSLNYLAGVLTADIRRQPAEVLAARSLGSLDLGGESLIVSLLIDEAQDDEEDEHHYEVNIGGQLSGGRPALANVYARSYPAGYNAFRFHLLKSATNQGACLPPDFNAEWSYNGANHRYSTSAATKKKSSGKDCYKKVQKLIKSLDMDFPFEMRHKKFYAFSFFQKKATEYGLIEKDDSVIHNVTVQDFYDAMIKECSDFSHYKSSKSESGFLCADLSYINGLLTDAFHFPKNSVIHLASKIGDHYLNWCLGSMLDILYNSK